MAVAQSIQKMFMSIIPRMSAKSGCKRVRFACVHISLNVIVDIYLSLGDFEETFKVAQGR